MYQQWLQVAGLLFTPGSPGYIRGVTVVDASEVVVTTGMGQVARWRPERFESEVLAEGFDRLYGVAIAPGGSVVVVEGGRGRVLSIHSGQVEELAHRWAWPSSRTAPASSRRRGAGRVVRLSGGRVEVVVDGLQRPQGVMLREGRLYVLDVGAKSLVECDLSTGARRTLAADGRAAQRLTSARRSKRG